MAGHSKWANIQHRKGRQDKKRGKLFTKLIREITVAAKIGGGDLSSNPRLRSAIDNAKSQSMPKDNIERAIAKGTGGDDGTTLEEVIYEGYGPGGVAILIECMTDNRNRTVAEVRHALTKHGGNLGTEGSVAYLFEQIGYISITKSSDPESLIEVAIESGAEDIEINDDGSVEIETKPQDLIDVKESIVVGQSWDNDVRIILFVVMNKPNSLDDFFIQKIKKTIRTEASPRHVPVKIIEVSDIPRTKNGKIVELAVKNIIEGNKIKNIQALANPYILKEYKNLKQLKI